MIATKPLHWLLLAGLLLSAGCGSTRQTKQSDQDYGVVTLRPSALPRIAPDRKQRGKNRAILPDWILATVVARSGGGLLLVDGWLEPSQRGTDEGNDRPGTSLEDTIDLLKQGLWPRVMLAGEEKPLVEAMRLLAKQGLTSRAAAVDTDLAALDRIRTADPKLRLFYGPVLRLEEERAAMLRDRGVACVVAPPSGIEANALATMHRAGLSAGVWQADDEDQVTRLMRLGADYYFSGNPDVVIDAQVKEGVRPSTIRRVKRPVSTDGSAASSRGMFGR